jgi:hypothetical protein
MRVAMKLVVIRWEGSKQALLGHSARLLYFLKLPSRLYLPSPKGHPTSPMLYCVLASISLACSLSSSTSLKLRTKLVYVPHVLKVETTNPIGPNKLALQETCLRACEPHTKACR